MKTLEDHILDVRSRLRGTLESDIWDDTNTEEMANADLAAEYRKIYPDADLPDHEAAERYVSGVRQHAVVIVSGEVFTDWLTEGSERRHTKCVAGLPEGAKFIGWSPRGGHPLDIMLYYEHYTFPFTHPGSQMPVIDVQYRVTEDAPCNR